MRLPGRKFNNKLEKTVNHSLPESASDSIQSAYLTPFALALGATNIAIGFIAAIPWLFKILVQPFAGKFIEHHENKRSTLFFSVMTTAFWIPILFIPFIFTASPIFWLVVFLSISGVFLTVYNNAWTTWMAELVPDKIRGEVFAKRNMYVKFSAFVSTLLAGWVLGLFEKIEGFLLIFGASILLGFFADFMLSRVKYPKIKPRKHHKHKFSTSFKYFIKTFANHKNFFNFVVYRSLFNFSRFLIAPFIIVYMLDGLGIGYFWYAVVVALTAGSAIFSSPYWGKISDRFGDRRILYIVSILSVFLPFFWAFTTQIWQVLLISMAVGFVFSGLGLTNMNYLIDVTPPKHRPSYLANYKMITFVPVFIAPLLGGYLADWFGGVVFYSLTGMPLLFLLAAFIRAISLFSLITLRETRLHGKKVPVKNIFWKVSAIYPAKGFLHEIHIVQKSFIDWDKKFGKH